MVWLVGSKEPGPAKKAANEIVTNESWANIKLDIMRSILKSKFNHSSKFQVALKETGNKQLVHNVENDSFWGCGEDGLGANMLGMLLEELRKSDIPSVSPAQPHGTQATAQAPNLESTSQTQKPQPTDKTSIDMVPKVATNAKKVIIISDSMLRDVVSHLTKKNLMFTQNVMEARQLPSWQIVQALF